jgi:hypothetical protein
MIVFLMVLEPFICISVKALLFNTANETQVSCVIDDSNIYVSQLSKGIDDDTENDIEKNCDDKQEERQIVNGPEKESLSICRVMRLGRQEFSDTSSTSHTIINS